MKYAWIENDRIRDVADGNPVDLYHPDIAVFYDTEVPDDAANGDGWVNGVLVKPEPVEPPAPVEPTPKEIKVSPIEFKLLFTSQERIAIKTARATDPILDDFYEIVEDPRLDFIRMGLDSVKQGIGYLVLKGLLAPERMNEVLSGKFK